MVPGLFAVRDHLRSGIICSPGSFVVQDHLRSGIICSLGSFVVRDHLRSGIICGPGIICSPGSFVVPGPFADPSITFYLCGFLDLSRRILSRVSKTKKHVSRKVHNVRMFPQCFPFLPLARIRAWEHFAKILRTLRVKAEFCKHF